LYEYIIYFYYATNQLIKYSNKKEREREGKEGVQLASEI